MLIKVELKKEIREKKNKNNREKLPGAPERSKAGEVRGEEEGRMTGDTGGLFQR